MNSINEKEKKLISVLDELKNLDLTNPKLQNNIENLSNQKNQLEIEKQELEEKYKSLINDYKDLSSLNLFERFFNSSFFSSTFFLVS